MTQVRELARHHRRATVSHAARMEEDRSTVVGAEGPAGLHRDRTLGGDELPVGSARHDLALQVGAFDAASRDWNDAGAPAAQLADVVDLTKHGADGADQACL
jgi:hypothetical protein